MDRAPLPSTLLALAKRGVYPEGLVAYDTETSGLFVDDGARASTASVAWEDPGGVFLERTLREGPGDGTHNRRLTRVGKKSREISSVAWPFDQGLSYTGKPEDHGQGTIFPDAPNLDPEEWTALLEWLQLLGAKKGPYLVFHHFKFDAHITRAGLRTRGRTSGAELVDLVAWDTQNVADLLWGWEPTTALKATSQRIFGDAADDEQQKVKDYLRKNKLPTGRWDLLPWNVIGEYADKDAFLTLRLQMYQQWVIDEGLDGEWLTGTQGKLHVSDAVQRRLQVSQMLYRMELRGLPFAAQEVGRVAAELRKREKQLVTELPFTPATIPAAKHYWFGHGKNKAGVQGLGMNALSLTESGQPQLNAYVVRKLAERGTPGVEVWRNLTKVKTANERWYSGWGSMLGDDGRLRGNIRQNGTVSGRFSISRVQLQAIPHNFRLEGYSVLEGVPTPRDLIGLGVPEGYQLWELDLANAELRVAALMAGCQRMLSLIGEGADLHGDAATQLFDAHPGSRDWGKIRGVAKRANFSLIFGVGWEKLQADIDTQTGVVLTDLEAQKLVHDWNNLYPEYQRAIRMTSRVVRNRQIKHAKGWVQALNGERRWFGRDEETHKAFNQRVQSNLAQFGASWWLEGEKVIDRELTTAGYGDELERVGLVMLIHDSMVLLLPKADGLDRKVVELVQQVGVDLWDKTFTGVPGGVDAKVWGGGD